MAIRYFDIQRDKWYMAGFVLGDFSLYKKVGEDNKGNVAAIQKAANQKQFEGTVNSDGTLTYMGTTAYWQTLSNIP